MEEKTTIVEIRNLNKSYRRGSQIVPVLHDINFDIGAVEFLVLMGPFGSGKTTLLKIAGIDRADSGTSRIGDVDITSLSEMELAQWRARNVGFIFQFYNLIPVLTAFENVELPLHLTGLSRRERREHVEMALPLVNLSQRMDHYPKELSGGEQQRVAIARAIVTDPTLLVADEPTGDLDRVSAEEILDLIERLNRELRKTIIMVTHDPRAAKRAQILRHSGEGRFKQCSFSKSSLEMLFGINFVPGSPSWESPSLSWPSGFSAENARGEAVELFRAPDDRAEATWIARRIREWAGRRSYEDVAVLYRTNAQSRQMEEAFRLDKIPYQVVGAVQFYERKEVKDVLAYLKLLANPADDVAFRQRRCRDRPRGRVGRRVAGPPARPGRGYNPPRDSGPRHPPASPAARPTRAAGRARPRRGGGGP